MTKIDFLITYDIACPKRLRKIAKTLEMYAYRIQKSIFFLPKATLTDMKNLTLKLESTINKNQDDLRVYQVNINNSLFLFSGIDLININLLKELQ